MQLYRNHTSTLIDFASSLEKVAKVTASDLILKRQAEARVSELRDSNEKYAPAKAFAKGMGVSFVLPLALGLGAQSPTEMLKEIKEKSQEAYTKNILKEGLLESGLNQADSRSLANVLYRNQAGIIDPTNPGLMVQSDLERAIRNNISSELRGVRDPQFITEYKGAWKVLQTNNPQLNQINTAIASGKPLTQEGTKDILRGISATYYGGQKSPDVVTQFNKIFVEPTVDHIMETKFKGTSSGALLSRMQYKQLHDLGEQRMARLGDPGIDVNKFQKNLLKKSIVKKLKIPAVVGTLGGITAVLRNKKNKEQYKELLQEVRRQNERS